MARTKKQNPHLPSPTTTPYHGRGGPNAWNTHEKSLFQQGVLTHGWGAWILIEPMISTRTNAQIKSHAQKFKIHHPTLVKELLERRHNKDHGGRGASAANTNRGGGREGLSVASSTMKSAAAAKRRRDNYKMKKKKPVIDIYNDASITNAISGDGDGVTPPNKTHSNNIDNRPTTPRRNKRSMTLHPPAAAVAEKKRKKKAQHKQQQSPDNSSIHVMVTDDTNKSIVKQAKYKSSLSSSTKPHCNKARSSGTVAISKAKVKVKVQPKMNKALPLPLRWSASRSIASSNSNSSGSSSPLRRSARTNSKCSPSNATPNKDTTISPTKKPRRNNEVTIQRYNATAPFRILRPVDVVGMKEKNVVSPATTGIPTTTGTGGTTCNTGGTTFTNAAANAVNANISSPSSLSNAVNVARSITVVTPTDNNNMQSSATTTTTIVNDSIHQKEEEENDDELAVLAASVADIHPEEQEDGDDGSTNEGGLCITARQILPQELAWLEQCSSDNDNEQFDKFDNDIMSIDLSEDTIDALSLSSSFGSMDDANDNADDADDADDDADEYEPHQLCDIKNGGNGGDSVDDLNLKIDDEDIAGMLSSFLMNPISSSSENNNKDDEKEKLMEAEEEDRSGGEDNGCIIRNIVPPRAQELEEMDPSLPSHRRSSYYYNYFGQDYNHSSFITTAPSRRDPPALATTTPTTPPQHHPILLITPSHPFHFMNKVVRPDPNAYHSIHAHVTSAPDYNNPKEYVEVRSDDDDNGLVSRMGREKGELCRARLRDYLIGEHLEVEWWKKNGAGGAAGADSNSHWYHCHDNLNDSSASSSSSALASTGVGGRSNCDNNAAWTASVIMALPPLGQSSATLGGLGEVLAQESSSSSSIGGGSSETLCKRELLNFNKKSALERLIAVTAVMTQVDHWHTLSMMAGSVTTTSATTTSSDGTTTTTTTTTLLMETAAAAAAAAARRFNEEDDIRAIGQLVKGLWERVNRSLGRDNYTLLGNSSGVGDDNDCIFARMERNDAINSMVMRLDLLSRQE